MSEGITLAPIPHGWVFTTADNSEDRCTVLFCRANEPRKLWHTLNEEAQARVPLYVSGGGPTLTHAWKNACNAARSAATIETVTEIATAGGAS